MRVDRESGRLRVYGEGEVVCRIDAEGWSACADPPGIDTPVETTVAGRTSRVRFPPGRVACGSTPPSNRPGDRRRADTVAVRAPIRIDTGVTAVIAFEGTATVHDRPEGVDVSFAKPRPVTLGLRSPGVGERAIAVPATPEGVATALTHSSAAHAATGPERSDPATRRNPPRIERAETIGIPGWIRSERTDTGIELRVPPDLECLFVLASLSYYLGARVTVEPRETPILRVPEFGVRRELPALPELQAGAASLLYRIVTLDCLVRNARSRSTSVADRRLDAIGVDPDRVGDRDPGGRLAAYLDAPFSEIESDLPEWHLSVYATPTPEHVTALPYVLDRLAFVSLPDARPLPDEERLQRSLADFYRGLEEAPTVEPLLPDLNRGRLHAWLADGVAVDAFKFLPESHENRQVHPAAGGEPTTVTLVINDAEMSPELDAVGGIYRGQSDDPGVDLRVERRLERDALAATLGRPTDLLHYIGHCDASGFRCPDGHLDAADIDHSGSRVFFLNACGSYHQGVSLLEAGSVAGAVTLRPVLDDQAKRVGTAFARLLTRGFAVGRALRIASRRSIVNKDYAVVGDGTYALAGPGDTPRAVARIDRAGDRYLVRVEHGVAHATATVRHSVPDGGVCLSGAERRVRMSRPELCAFLRNAAFPTVYEGRYYWSEDLRRGLVDGDMEGRSGEP